MDSLQPGIHEQDQRWQESELKPSGDVVMIAPAMGADERGVIKTTPHYSPLLLRDIRA